MSNSLFAQSPIDWKPHSGQKLGMKFLLENGAAVMAADPGVGKTSMVFGAFKVLRKKNMAEKMLVVAPLKPCYLVWPKERDKWIDFNSMKVEVLHDKNRTEEAVERADICVINPEGLDWLFGAKRTKNAKGKTSVTIDLRRLKSFGFDTLVIDELTRFKHVSSGRFKMMKLAAPHFSRRWGLTGSLVANGLMDLFGQCYVMDLGRSLGQYVSHYRARYFEQSYDGFSWTLREGAEEEIYERVSPLILRLAADDYVDMPEVVEVPHYFDLDKKSREIYNRLENDMISKIDDRVVVAATAASASIKCRQVASGGIYLDPEVLTIVDSGAISKSKREFINLHMDKAEILEDIVEELQGSPLFVGYDFAHDLDRLRQKFGKDIPYIGGGVSGKKATEIEKAWNAGKLPILLGHPKSVAHGLNLQQSGHHVAWHSLTWDYEEYDQFIRRIRRQGSKARRIFVHHILARDTIDETMLWALRAKSRGQTACYEALLELRKKRRGRK